MRIVIYDDTRYNTMPPTRLRRLYVCVKCFFLTICLKFQHMNMKFWCHFHHILPRYITLLYKYLPINSSYFPKSGNCDFWTTLYTAASSDWSTSGVTSRGTRSKNRRERGRKREKMEEEKNKEKGKSKKIGKIEGERWVKEAGKQRKVVWSCRRGAMIEKLLGILPPG